MAIQCSEQGYKWFEVIRNAVIPVGIFLFLPGIVLTVVMYLEDETQIYGPILLGVACTLLFTGFILCIVSAMLEKNGALKKPGSVEPIVETRQEVARSTAGAPPPYQPPPGGGFTYSSPSGQPPPYSPPDAIYPPPPNAAYPPPPPRY